MVDLDSTVSILTKRAPLHKIGLTNGTRNAAVYGASPYENVNFFRPLKDKSSEEIEPAVKPSPLPEATPPSSAIKPISVNDAQYVLLTNALRPREARVLKDLSVNGPGSKVPQVIGGASQPSSAAPPRISPDQPPGAPII